MIKSIRDTLRDQELSEATRLPSRYAADMKAMVRDLDSVFDNASELEEELTPEEKKKHGKDVQKLLSAIGAASKIAYSLR
jgi:hypothetical protein